MTNYPRGTIASLTVTFYEYVGGPATNVTNLTVTITRVSDGVVVVGPTSVGVTNIGVGTYRYAWDISEGMLIDDYLVAWSSDEGDANETIGVISAIATQGTGPCETWPAIWTCELDAAGVAVTGTALEIATEILWGISGRRFGLCTVTLRPCRRECLPVPWPGSLWPSYTIGQTYPTPVNLGGGEWLNLGCSQCSRGCSCAVLHDAILPAPVYDIVNVKVDGETLSSTAYRVDESRILVRVDGEAWPLCNNLALADTEVGTWSVTARYGEVVPPLGQLAAGELACEIVKILTNDNSCALPQPVQQVVRQGVAITFLDPNEAFKDGRIGLRTSDLFVQTYNPHRLQRRSQFYDVDDSGFHRIGSS